MIIGINPRKIVNHTVKVNKINKKYIALILLLVISVNIKVIIVNAQEKYEISLIYETDSFAGGVSVSLDGKYMIAGDSNNVIYFFDKQGKLLWNYRTGGEINAVSISYDGNYAVAGSYDNNIYFFNKNGSLLWEYQTEGKIVGGVSISSDGSYVVAGSEDKKIYFFNREGNILWEYETEKFIYDVSLSADGEYIVAGTWGMTLGWVQLSHNKIYFLNKEGELLWEYEEETTGFSVSLSQNGKYVAAGSREMDNAIYLFNEDGDIIWKHNVDGDVSKVSISSDGNYTFAVIKKQGVYLLNKRGEIKWEYVTDDSLYDVSISPKAEHLSIGSGSKFYSFMRNDVFAYFLINETESLFSSLKSKGIIISEAEPFLVQSYQALNSSNYQYAISMAKLSKIKALEIEIKVNEASISINNTKAIILEEISRGYYVSKTEIYLSQAENSYNLGNYTKAIELSNKAYNLSIDVDQDKIINSNDFSPYINNYYIHYGIIASFIIIGVSVAIFKRSSHIKEEKMKKTVEEEKLKRRKNELDELEQLISEAEVIIEFGKENTENKIVVSALILLEEKLLSLFEFLVRNKNDFIYGDMKREIFKILQDAQNLASINDTKEYGTDGLDINQLKGKIPLEELSYLILGVDKKTDSYTLLGISKFASKEEIDKAYRQKQLDWHPDRFKTDRGKKLGNEISKKLNGARDKIYENRGW